jgi:tRNA(fMet)-specific endonuclease VapC
VAGFLLDTTVLIDLAKDYRAVRSSLQELVSAGHMLAVSAVSVAEFCAGVPPPQRTQWEWWVAGFEYWDISREAAILAGRLRYELARQGRALHIPDALMAATAITAGVTLVTNNVKDYSSIELKLMRLGA